MMRSTVRITLYFVALFVVGCTAGYALARATAGAWSLWAALAAQVFVAAILYRMALADYKRAVEESRENLRRIAALAAMSPEKLTAMYHEEKRRQKN